MTNLTQQQIASINNLIQEYAENGMTRCSIAECINHKFDTDYSEEDIERIFEGGEL